MFSLISLYFAYRRDVVMAERYVAGLADKPAAVEPTAIVAGTEAPKSVELPLAA